MSQAIQQAIAHLNANQPDQAKAILRRVLQKDSRNVEANKLLAMLHAGIDETDQALFYIKRAVDLSPNDPLLRFMHGNVLMILKKDPEAADAYRHTNRLAPTYFEGYDGLAKILLRMGRHDDAVAAYEQGLAHNPDDPSAYRMYALALSTMGRVPEGLAVLRRGIAHLPSDSGLRESLCYQSNFADDVDPDLALKEHAELGRLVHQENARLATPILKNSRVPDRKLRIGFVSGDFCSHACAMFMEGPMAALNRDLYEPYCYYARDTIEPATKRFEAMSHFRHCFALNDEQLRAQVVSDQIDILIDTAGWTELHRLRAFTPRIAPIQMTWLGYPNTTGIPTIDYRIVDAITDPPGSEQHCTEKLLRLPGCFVSFQPSPTSPPPKLSAYLDPSESPSLREGLGWVASDTVQQANRQDPDKLQGAPPSSSHPTSDVRHPTFPLTFGSFNRLSKVRPAVARTWAKILAQVPDSRLFLKSSLVSDDVKAQYHREFIAEGVSPDRILWSSFLPSLEHHLAAYHQVDIALDSFPYHGTTTTCEATWMGVPVITLKGNVHRSRVGASLLTALNLESHIASTPDEYIRIAVDLANDRPRLLELHQTLRDRMARSPLCDSIAFARKLETALRTAWRTWCAQTP